MTPIRLVTFDITNTVIRVLGNVGQNYANIASLYNTSVDPVKLDSSFKSVFRWHTEQYPNFGTMHGMSPSKWWTNVVVESFTKSGCDVSNLEQIASHLYLYFSTNKGWEIIPHAEQTLMQLKQSGMKIGVVSNFDERLEKILKELALRHYFDFVLSSTVVKTGKPEVEIFKMALEIGNVPASEAMHVGDNVINDYHGARNAGMRSLLLWKRDKKVPENVDRCHVIHELDELLNCLS